MLCCCQNEYRHHYVFCSHIRHLGHMGKPPQHFRIKSFGLIAMNHPIESWDIAIPSLGVYTTLTKEECGQWVKDFGTSGVMRMTYFGALNKKRIPRFDVSMASNDRTDVLCTMDIDGNWLNARDEILDVSLTPTILNVLARLSALETSAYANVNLAIQSSQETGRKLTEKVVKLEEQSNQRAEYVFNLVTSQQQQCEVAVRKVEAMVADMERNLRALHESVLKDVVDQMSTTRDEATLRLDAITQQLTREVEVLKEKMHYTHVKKENDQENDAAEQIALLKGTIGTCLLQQSEMHQSITGLTKSVCAIQQDLGTRCAQEVVDLSPETSKAHLEPGEMSQFRSKRLRR